MQKTDLHTHTSFSDGHLNPEELLKKAAGQGIEIISITDHDSINAFEVAKSLENKFGIEVIPGLEISSDIRDTEVHILGYFIDPQNKELEHYLHFFREERYKRAIRIVEKLNILGLKITMEDVMERANNSAIGRPHIAQALLLNDQVKSYFEAFYKYLGNHAPAYERKVHLSPQSAFKIISDAGGLSFIAHPGNMPEILVKELIDAGVDGIEVVHPSHTPERIKFYRGIVNEYFLLESGGSDYHGGKREDDDNLGKYFTSTKAVEAMRLRLMRNTS
ncbi:MAG: PHP domain-containing protein [Ignavibacteria bacterium]|nr:PHP domain-containing protein [Ignavibacteria bacterium]MBT8383931.1 PHP domain-containing protein [Ignavibacteria bacterium]MBT8391468.1 PHP domain-containing protein [Ignavibacteria bacterium]NNJ54131.1 PHP domain-containing protein [Ignavibacteriaceae bacterium]NNL21398.1 PHP domain-containing protein [Ignavibacteriaceae bacterium]